MFIFIFLQSAVRFVSEVDVVIGSYLISITHAIMALDMNTALTRLTRGANTF